MKNFRILPVAMAAVMSGACYTQQPLATLPPAPTTHIIAQLTDSGTVAMSNAIGAGALEVEGVVTTANQQSWTLQMLRVDHRDGRSINWNREAVAFPASVLTQPLVKVLDRRKSWLAAGGITVGAFVLARAFNMVGANEEDDDDGEQPQQIVIPVGGRR